MAATAYCRAAPMAHTASRWRPALPRSREGESEPRRRPLGGIVPRLVTVAVGTAQGAAQSQGVAGSGGPSCRRGAVACARSDGPPSDSQRSATRNSEDVAAPGAPGFSSVCWRRARAGCAWAARQCCVEISLILVQSPGQRPPRARILELHLPRCARGGPGSDPPWWPPAGRRARPRHESPAAAHSLAGALE